MSAGICPTYPSSKSDYRIVHSVKELTSDKPPMPRAFDDAAVEALVEAFEHGPFGVCDGEVVEGHVSVATVIVEQLEACGHCVIVRDRTLLAVLQVEGWEVAEAQLEIDGVLVRRFPFEDVLVCAEDVARVLAGEDEAIITVFEVGEDVLVCAEDVARVLVGEDEAIIAVFKVGEDVV
jgi:hypothetical protein